MAGNPKAVLMLFRLRARALRDELGEDSKREVPALLIPQHVLEDPTGIICPGRDFATSKKNRPY